MTASAKVALALVVLAATGCRGDRCLGEPAQAQIDVQLSGIAAQDVTEVSVTLVINSTVTLTRSFPTATPSFVFEFKAEENRPPRSLGIKAVATSGGRIVGAGDTPVNFADNACNFFTVVVRPASVGDAGMDLEPPDAGRDSEADGSQADGKGDVAGADAAKPDAAGKTDGPPVDVGDVDVGKADTGQDGPPPDAPKPDLSICGNGKIEGTEECDGTTFPVGKSACQDFERNGGNLQCTGCKFDLSLCCTAPVPPAMTGKGWDVIVSGTVGDDATIAPLCNPYKTITAAVKSGITSLGSTYVYVAPGTYSAGEIFPIKLTGNPYVMLFADHYKPLPTVIDGSGPSTLAAGNATLEASGNNSIQGFQIKGGSGSAVQGIVSVGDDTTGTAVWHNTFLTDVGIHASSAVGCPVMIQNNTFNTQSLGVHFECQNGTLEDNTFTGGTGVQLPSATTGIVVKSNTFTGGTVGIAVEAGSPQITGNTFSGAQSSAAVTCAGSSAPVLRGNLFSVGVAPKRAVSISGTASPDLGTASAAGQNTFFGAALEHAGSATVNAIGNDWPGAPSCGTGIVVTGTGKIVWGTIAGQECP